MQKVLFVTFDLIRPNDPEKSLAMASILASLRGCESLKTAYAFEHLSINVLRESWRERIALLRFGGYSFIAVSAYIWCEPYLNEFLACLRTKGFGGKIILGGYQIAGARENFKKRYPLADIFIEGFAERKLIELFTGKPCGSVETPPPVYLAGEIEVKENAEMVRMETKRGCPYACSFCRHRDVVDNSIIEFGRDRVCRELDYLTSKNVKKINVVDPIFHIGKNYEYILEEMNALCERKGVNTLFSLQCRFEFLATSRGERFLDLCRRGNFLLEFGLQTVNEAESALINRRNELDKIEKALEMVNDSGISYEISLMYGLPNQTLESFKYGIEWLKERCVGTVKAFPLKLLPGTPLYDEKDKWGFEERKGELGIPFVVSSRSFTYEEWLEMGALGKV